MCSLVHPLQHLLDVDGRRLTPRGFRRLLQRPLVRRLGSRLLALHLLRRRRAEPSAKAGHRLHAAVAASRAQPNVRPVLGGALARQRGERGLEHKGTARGGHREEEKAGGKQQGAAWGAPRYSVRRHLARPAARSGVEQTSSSFLCAPSTGAVTGPAHTNQAAMRSGRALLLLAAGGGGWCSSAFAPHADVIARLGLRAQPHRASPRCPSLSTAQSVPLSRSRPRPLQDIKLVTLPISLLLLLYL